MITEYLTKKPDASRQDIDELLISVFPKVLSEKQKKNKVRNLLYDLSKRDKTIINRGDNRNPKWEINN